MTQPSAVADRGLAEIAAGEIAGLFRWPVKSMGGNRLTHVQVTSRGVVGDRAHAVQDEFRGRPRILTARQAPGLLDWQATYEDVAPSLERLPLAHVTAPGGQRFRWDDPELAPAISEHLGRPVSLVRRDSLIQDLPESVLVTVAASHAAVERRLGPLALERWRTNLHVRLDADAFAEEGWEGGILHAGEASFRLLHPCRRCVIPTRNPGLDDQPARWPELLRWLADQRGTLFGINARPLNDGNIGIGEPVWIERYRR